MISLFVCYVPDAMLHSFSPIAFYRLVLHYLAVQVAVECHYNKYPLHMPLSFIGSASWSHLYSAN